MDIELKRAKLVDFVSYAEGEEIRSSLKKHADEHYVRQHTAEEYMTFINGNACTFHIQHAQSQNFPYFWGMFTVISQHVYGDCVEECLDKAMKFRGLTE